MKSTSSNNEAESYNEVNIQIEFQKIGISITTAEFLLDRAISKDHKDNILKVIEGKNLKVKLYMYQS